MSEPEFTTLRWQPIEAWTGLAAAGRYGSIHGSAGVQFTPCEGLGLATVIARSGRHQELALVLSEHLGLVPPEPRKVTSSTRGTLVWSGPGQWLLVTKDRALIRDISRDLEGIAAVSDQSDARAVLRLTGPRIRNALAKGCLIDLHPRRFGPGDTAQTAIAHIGVQIWQIDDAPIYDIAVFRSMAASFWTWLTEASAELGYEVTAPARG